MTIELRTPGPDLTDVVLDALREWQGEGAAVHLHPGDIGWFHRFGPAATTAALRVWSRHGRPVAVGLLDGPRLLRLNVAPEAYGDGELAERLVRDLADPARGVLGEGRAVVEAPMATSVHRLLAERGWAADEPWTPLRRDLTDPVPDPGLRIEVAGPDRVADRVAVQRAAFTGSTFTRERWDRMAAGAPYADARCLVAYDDRGTPVATATVWSAGPDRPGLLEPLGVHAEHRGRGHGRAMAVAAASALRGLGASCALVTTPASNVPAVATYRAAGFRALPETHDSRRE